MYHLLPRHLSCMRAHIYAHVRTYIHMNNEGCRRRCINHTKRPRTYVAISNKSYEQLCSLHYPIFLILHKEALFLKYYKNR